MNIFDAIRSEDLKTVKAVLSNQPELLNTKNDRGSSPILLAAYLGAVEITKYILSLKPEVDAVDASGNTALMGVAFKGSTNIAKLLIEAGADVNAKNTQNSTALIYAATFGQKEIINLLVANGADIYAEDINGNTAINLAQRQGVNLLELKKV